MGRYTKSLAGGWQANLQGSMLRSEAHQVGLFNNAAATGVGIGGNGGGLNLFHFGPGAAPTPAFPDSFPFVLTVPANYPGNTTGDTANLVYDFRDIGPLEQTMVTTSYRAVAELAGSIGEWDLNGSVGYTRVGTKASFHHYIDFPALQDALDSGSYLVDGRNSAAELATVAPGASSTSTNDLTFVSVRGNTHAGRPGGRPAGLGIGADFTHRQLKELFPPSFVNGSQAIGIYSFAEGKQTVSAAYAELVAPVTKQLEIDVAGRVDHYDTTGTSATPKAGFKFTPVQRVHAARHVQQGLPRAEPGGGRRRRLHVGLRRQPARPGVLPERPSRHQPERRPDRQPARRHAGPVQHRAAGTAVVRAAPQAGEVDVVHDRHDLRAEQDLLRDARLLPHHDPQPDHLGGPARARPAWTTRPRSARSSIATRRRTSSTTPTRSSTPTRRRRRASTSTWSASTTCTRPAT